MARVLAVMGLTLQTMNGVSIATRTVRRALLSCESPTSLIRTLEIIS